MIIGYDDKLYNFDTKEFNNENISYVKMGDRVFYGKVKNLNTDVNLEEYKIEENIDIQENYNEETFIQSFFDLLKEKP